MFNPMFIECIVKVYEMTNDLDDLNENLDIFMDNYRERRFCLNLSDQRLQVMLGA